MIYFTSDTHFGHANVIKYAKRPFANVEEMDAEMIKRWNEVVKPKDDVFHIGDLSFHKHDKTKEILDQLNGKIYLVKGNHDKQFPEKRFVWIKDYFEFKHEKQLIVMCHYAFRTWRNSHHGSWNIHGHSHGTLESLPHLLQHDVGVDVNDFRPISFEQLKCIMATKTFKPVDHHGADRHEH